jgi:hypothetical protein
LCLPVLSNAIKYLPTPSNTQGAVTVQRSEVTSCNFTAPIATFGASSNPREFLLHPNRTQISQPRQSDGSRPVSRSLVARCSRIRSLRTASLTGRLVLRSPSALISANQCLASGPALFTFPSTTNRDLVGSSDYNFLFADYTSIGDPSRRCPDGIRPRCGLRSTAKDERRHWFAEIANYWSARQQSR